MRQRCWSLLYMMQNARVRILLLFRPIQPAKPSTNALALSPRVNSPNTGSPVTKFALRHGLADARRDPLADDHCGEDGQQNDRDAAPV